jgi:AAA+ ATPase superfamily predicted ATPase
MNIPFLDRKDEERRLRSALQAKPPVLAVVYGRRRCGKSTLLRRVARPRDVFFLANLNDAALQRAALATEIGRTVKGFDEAVYPSWDALLNSLADRAPRRLSLFVDEFPYLAQTSPELPSVLQAFLESAGADRINLVLCGSSQRMMHGLVLDRTAPLYGRAREILKVRPLAPGWIRDALGLDGVKAVNAYSVWGGVPRYWELARDYPSLDAAVKALVLDRNGVLHEEPLGLLLDDMRTAGQAHSLLSLIASGCHRLSEIAGRMEKPAGTLTRPLANLIDLGYVRRELPFGETAKTTKRTLYKLNDPFLQFHFRFIQAHLSMLELGLTQAVETVVKKSLSSHVSTVWEALARESAPFIQPGGIQWGAATRWWGRGTDDKPLEVDVVAESMDRTSLLVGEAKWTASRKDVGRIVSGLNQRVQRLPFVHGRRVVLALWLKEKAQTTADIAVLTPEDVLDVLK